MTTSNQDTSGPVGTLIAQLGDAVVPGGCDYCEAEQSFCQGKACRVQDAHCRESAKYPGVFMLHTVHEDRCPFLAVQNARSAVGL